MRYILIIGTSILARISMFSFSLAKADIFVSPGNSYTTIGGTTYGSDGSSATTIGGTTYFSNETSCAIIGGTTYCN